MTDLRELYQEVIIDHSRNPRNFHEFIPANHKAEGFNRLCGDKLTLYVQLEDNVIKHICFQGSGCAISTASASLMTECLLGKTKSEAEVVFTNFHNLLTSNENCEESLSQLGKLTVLAGVKEFPARVKCATLAWHTLQAALNDNKQTISTEEPNL